MKATALACSSITVAFLTCAPALAPQITGVTLA
jgi:hypothetical protein